jgi:hypothetical protein
MKKIILFSAVLGFSQAVLAVDRISIPLTPSDVPNKITVNVDPSQKVDLRLPACTACGESWKIVGVDADFATSTIEDWKGLVDIVDTNVNSHLKRRMDTQVIHFPLVLPGHNEFKLEYSRREVNQSNKPTVMLVIDMMTVAPPPPPAPH